MYQIPGIDSKFRLVLLAAKRAKQLIMGDKRRVEIKSENPLTTALEELSRSKITIEDLASIDHKIEAQVEISSSQEEADLAQILANITADSSEEISEEDDDEDEEEGQEDEEEQE